jgi:hypothetical protein
MQDAEGTNTLLLMKASQNSRRDTVSIYRT